MGKKRIAIMDLSVEERQKKEKSTFKKPVVKKVLTPEPKQAEDPKNDDQKKAEPKTKKTVLKAKKTKSKTAKKVNKTKHKRIRSQRYLKAKKAIGSKAYPLNQAVALMVKLAQSKFDESVELHLTVKKDNLLGKVKLPHDNGKKLKTAIFDAKLETKIKAGKINFDCLVAKPADMVKITKYAKLLGPKGLMPNPKNGTISEKPKEAVKKLNENLNFKTEKKAPLVHLFLGKISMGEKKLTENIEALLTAVGLNFITKASICSTMGPGIKLKLN